MNKKHFFVFIALTLFLLIIIGCGDKDSGLVGVAMYDDGEAPAIPQGVQAKSVYLFSDPTMGSNQKRYKVVLRWNKVTENIKGEEKDNIIGYKIYRDDTNKPIGITDADTLIFEDNSSELREGKSYAYYVTAFDSLLRETRSDAQRIRISPTHASGHMPDRPLNVKLICESNLSITMVWDRPENISDLQEANDPIDSYIVYRKDGENGLFKILTQVAGDQSFFCDPMVVEGTRYYYKVRAVTESGMLGIESEVKSKMVTYDYNDDGFAPGAPLWDKVVETTKDGNPHARRLTWESPEYADNGSNGSDPASNVAGYKIFRSESKKDGYNLEALLEDKTSWTDVDTIGVDGNPVDYWYKIAAYDHAGNTSDKTAPLKVGKTPVDMPREFRGEIDHDDYIILRWLKEPGYDYHIYESRNGSVFRRMRENFNDETIPDYGEFEYSPRRVQDNKFYYYKISAVDKTSGEESNKTYFVRIHRYEGAAGPQIVEINATNMVNSVQARTIIEATDGFQRGWNVINDDEYILRTDARNVDGENIQTLHFSPANSNESVTSNRDYWWASDGNSINSSSTAGLGYRTWWRWADQFRMVWVPQSSGIYNFEVEFIETETGGRYWTLLRTESSILGSGYDISTNSGGSTNYSNFVDWPDVYLNAHEPVYFVFSATQRIPETSYNHSEVRDNRTIDISKIKIERRD
ncbi:MAG: fibronectin type III domain-containing protein [Candidatus Muiribacteriota bacterium]